MLAKYPGDRAEVKIMRGQRFADFYSLSLFFSAPPIFFAVTRKFFAQILGKAWKLSSTLAVKIDTAVTETYGAEIVNKASLNTSENVGF